MSCGMGGTVEPLSGFNLVAEQDAWSGR